MIHGTCAGCGNEFSVPLKCSSRPAPKYCGRECYKKYGMAEMRVKAYASLAVKWGAETGHKKKRERNCETCGVLIDRKPSAKQRFCSKQCWLASPYALVRAPKPHCRHCNQEINSPAAHNRQFCSIECFRVWKIANPEYYYTSERVAVCRHCGKTIERAPSAKSQYCDQECFLASMRGKSKTIDPVTGEAKPIRGSLRWQRKLARAIFNNSCSRCGYAKVPEILQTHHRDHDPRNQAEDNLELLCPNCHEEDHFRTRTGRFGTHDRRKKKPYHETYNFQKYASDERVESVLNGNGDPGAR